MERFKAARSDLAQCFKELAQRRFYWVDANVSPVRGPNREIIGFQSVTLLSLDAEEIAAAQDAIQRIQAGDKSLYFSHGRIVKKQPCGAYCYLIAYKQALSHFWRLPLRYPL